MSPGDPNTAKSRLLEGVVEHLTESGLPDTSLRSIAAAIGTSHRMLSYHFDSREGLLIEVSRSVERRQREAFETMVSDEDTPPLRVMRDMARRLFDPALANHERLFFELYVRGLHDSGSNGFVPEAVDAWIDPASRLFKRLGFQGKAANHEARLALAVSRGLLLDLLATNDRKAVNAAMAAFVARYE